MSKNAQNQAVQASTQPKLQDWDWRQANVDSLLEWHPVAKACSGYMVCFLTHYRAMIELYWSHLQDFNHAEVSKEEMLHHVHEELNMFLFNCMDEMAGNASEGELMR